MKLGAIIIAIVIALSVLFFLTLKKAGQNMTFLPSNSGPSDVDIDWIEQTLKKTLPHFYRDFLMNYPDLTTWGKYSHLLY